MVYVGFINYDTCPVSSFRRHPRSVRKTGDTYKTRSSFDFRDVSYLERLDIFLISLWALFKLLYFSKSFDPASKTCLFLLLCHKHETHLKCFLFTLLATHLSLLSSYPLNIISFLYCVLLFKKPVRVSKIF